MKRLLLVLIPLAIGGLAFAIVKSVGIQSPRLGIQGLVTRAYCKGQTVTLLKVESDDAAVADEVAFRLKRPETGPGLEIDAAAILVIKSAVTTANASAAAAVAAALCEPVVAAATQASIAALRSDEVRARLKATVIAAFPGTFAKTIREQATAAFPLRTVALNLPKVNDIDIKARDAYVVTMVGRWATVDIADRVSARIADGLEPMSLTKAQVEPIQKDLGARMLWGWAALAVFVMVGSALFTAGSVIRANVSDAHRPIVVAGLVLGFAGAIVLGFESSTPMGARFVQEPLRQLLSELTWVSWFSRVMNGAAVGVTLWLFAAAASCTVDGQRTTDELLADLKRVRDAAAALLVLGVTEVGALHRLPAAWFDVDGAKAVEAVAGATALSFGVIATALLAGLYYPALWILSQRKTAAIGLAAAKQVAQSQAPIQSGPEWLQDLLAAVTAFAPFLVGVPLDKLLGLLG